MKKLDEVYMMILPDKSGVVYSAPMTTACAVWDDVVGSELLGTGTTRKYLHAKGYRVKKVRIVL